MPWGPANGNFKSGNFSRVCPSPERNLTTAADTRLDWLRKIENVLTGRPGEMSGSEIRQVQKIIDDRPSWAEFLIARFKGPAE